MISAEDAKNWAHETDASDREYEAAKGHPLKYPKWKRGPLDDKRRAWCLGCGRAVSPWGDLEDARRAGDAHVKSAAADDVAAVSGE